jgi:hypothetical protein
MMTNLQPVWRFSATLQRPEGAGTWTYLDIPAGAAAELGAKAQVKVRATVNGAAYRGSLMPHGDGRHFLVVKKAVRDLAHATAGDQVEVTLALDTEQRHVTTPDDLLAALARSPAAQAYYDRLAYSYKQAYVEWIEGAKRPETRANRVTGAVSRLLAKQHLK